MKLQGFEPVFTNHSRILIVGSMPSEASLAAGEYYAHRRNAFWPLLTEALRETWDGTYEGKLDMIRRHDLALWDVVGSCFRDGSMDSKIKDAEFNDFSFLFRQCPIHTVLCNGAFSYKIFHRSGYDSGLRVIQMPSTSPANARDIRGRKEIWISTLRNLMNGGQDR